MHLYLNNIVPSHKLINDDSTFTNYFTFCITVY